MKGYIPHIEKEAAENKNFRKVLFTAGHCQLVVMSLLPGEDIGEETHHLDQFIRFELGEGKVVLDDVETLVEDGDAVVIPEGTRHNIINTSTTEKLKLYTIYAPPEHPDGTVHTTKADAMAAEHKE